MAEVTTGYKHIERDGNGTARVAGTRSRVIDLAMEQRAFGYSPEEMQRQHPHLSLAQIHAALAYYWDHQGELDAEIERRAEEVGAAQQRMPPAPVMERLHRAKRDQDEPAS
jgi:uncharacterized protein (DUF433 family)